MQHIATKGVCPWVHVGGHGMWPVFTKCPGWRHQQLKTLLKSRAVQRPFEGQGLWFKKGYMVQDLLTIISVLFFNNELPLFKQNVLCILHTILHSSIHTISLQTIILNPQFNLNLQQKMKHGVLHQTSFTCIKKMQPLLKQNVILHTVLILLKRLYQILHNTKFTIMYTLEWNMEPYIRLHSHKYYPSKIQQSDILLCDWNKDVC